MKYTDDELYRVYYNACSAAGKLLSYAELGRRVKSPSVSVYQKRWLIGDFHSGFARWAQAMGLTVAPPVAADVVSATAAPVATNGAAAHESE